MFSAVFCGLPLPSAGSDVLPTGQSLFRPLLADPRQIQSLVSYYRFQGHNAADAALGGVFGLLRHDWGSWKSQWDVAGMAYSRFYISGDVNHFETEDFFADLPWELRRGNFSTRLTLYHESSHLGDDYIRTNGSSGLFSSGLPGHRFSQEAFQAEFSEDLPSVWLRLYAGDTQILHTIPSLGRQILQWGAQEQSPVLWRDSRSSLDAFLAWDLQYREYNQWNINSNLVAGIKLSSLKTGRDVRLQLGWFDGHSPFGQFILERERYADVGFAIDF